MNADIPMRNYAHIGDAVWELFVREYTVTKATTVKLLHEMTTKRVKASYQAFLLNCITDKLNEEELEIVRRARNCTIPVARRNNQNEYRLATSFEALIGFWHMNNKTRLNEIFSLIKNFDNFIE